MSSVPRIDDKDGTYSSGCTLSYWLDSLERPKFPKLTGQSKMRFSCCWRWNRYGLIFLGPTNTLYCSSI